MVGLDLQRRRRVALVLATGALFACTPPDEAPPPHPQPVEHGLCGPPCPAGSVCVYASATSEAPECVDATAVWDDGADPERHLVDAGGGWLRKRADAWERDDLRCNDGSPYAYYVSPGVGDAARSWLVYFQGGASCATAETCATRWLTYPNLMRQPRTVDPAWTPTLDSRTGAEQTGARAGLYSRDRADNPFRDWTFVHLTYCSSDLFTGTRRAEDDPSGLFFRGHAIAEGVRDELVGGIGATDPVISALAAVDRVVVAGSSAGGRGARGHLDGFADELKRRVPGLPVHGVLDSVFDVPVRPPQPLPEGSPGLLELWGAEPFGDRDCVEAHPEARSLCENGAHLLTGDGGVHDDHRDAGHLGVPGADERYASDGSFAFMSQHDHKISGQHGTWGMCVEQECDADPDCAPDEACLGSVCVRVEPCTPRYCFDGDEPCFGTAAPPACIGESAIHASRCDDGSACASGLCASGFCVERRADRCADDSQCRTGFRCQAGACTQRVSTEEQCVEPGLAWSAESATCTEAVGCGPSDPCGAGYTCRSPAVTPHGQVLAWGIRDELTGLPPAYGAFAPDSSVHAALVTNDFYDQEIDGTSFAEALGPWLDGDALYEERIASPRPVPVALSARDIHALTATGLPTRTEGTGCADDALALRVCAALPCDEATALHTLFVGDTDTRELDGRTPTAAEPVRLWWDAQPGCTPAGLEVPAGAFVTLGYRPGAGTVEAWALDIALPAGTLGTGGLTLPVALYVAAGGSAFWDPELTLLAAHRL